MTTTGLSYWGEGGSMTRNFAFSPCPLWFWLVLLVTTMLSMSSARVLDIPSMNFRPDGENEVAPLSSRSLDWYYPQMVHRFKRNEAETTTTTPEPEIRLCGYRLLDAMTALCGGRFVTVSRRSDIDMEDDRISPLRMQGSSSLIERLYNYFPTNQSEQSQKLSPAKEESRHFHYRRGIVDDCCKNTCTTSRMQMYCEKT